MPGYVFSELTPLDDLLAPATLSLVGGAELTVYVAMPPALTPRAGEVVARLREAGIRVGLWPLLEASDGYWANVWNGSRFAGRCRELLDELARRDLVPDELLIDLEPPIDVVKRVLRVRPPRPRPRFEPGGAAALAGLTEEVSSLCRVVATVAPMVCGPGGRGWQRLLGTPVDALRLERVFIMAYTSLLEGYGRGALARGDCEALLSRWSAEARRTFGERAAVAVGVAGVGALGDERPYRDAGELARDVAIARAGGCEHIALFNLAGALARPEPRLWLEALGDPPPFVDVPPPRARVRALLGAIHGVGRAFETLGRGRES